MPARPVTPPAPPPFDPRLTTLPPHPHPYRPGVRGRLAGPGGPVGDAIFSGSAGAEIDGMAKLDPAKVRLKGITEHVEGRAAALMRGGGIMAATLYISDPSGPCRGCQHNLTTMLPTGARLHVWWPGASQPMEFTGTGEAIRS